MCRLYPLIWRTIFCLSRSIKALHHPIHISQHLLSWVFRKYISNTSLPCNFRWHLVLDRPFKSVYGPKFIIINLELLLFDLGMVTFGDLPSWLAPYDQFDTAILEPGILHLLFNRLRVLHLTIVHSLTNKLLLFALHIRFQWLFLHVSPHHIQNKTILLFYFFV